MLNVSQMSRLMAESQQKTDRPENWRRLAQARQAAGQGEKSTDWVVTRHRKDISREL